MLWIDSSLISENTLSDIYLLILLGAPIELIDTTSSEILLLDLEDQAVASVQICQAWLHVR